MNFDASFWETQAIFLQIEIPIVLEKFQARKINKESNVTEGRPSSEPAQSTGHFLNRFGTPHVSASHLDSTNKTKVF